MSHGVQSNNCVALGLSPVRRIAEDFTAIAWQHVAAPTFFRGQQDKPFRQTSTRTKSAILISSLPCLGSTNSTAISVVTLFGKWLCMRRDLNFSDSDFSRRSRTALVISMVNTFDSLLPRRRDLSVLAQLVETLPLVFISDCKVSFFEIALTSCVVSWTPSLTRSSKRCTLSFFFLKPGLLIAHKRNNSFCFFERWRFVHDWCNLAERHVFCHFNLWCGLHGRGRVGTQWRLVSKDRLMALRTPGWSSLSLHLQSGGHGSMCRQGTQLYSWNRK